MKIGANLNVNTQQTIGQAWQAKEKSDVSLDKVTLGGRQTDDFILMGDKLKDMKSSRLGEFGRITIDGLKKGVFKHTFIGLGGGVLAGVGLAAAFGSGPVGMAVSGVVAGGVGGFLGVNSDMYHAFTS